MTAEILKRIKPEELKALHSVYVAIHRAHKTAPQLFTIGHCTTIITALMGSQTWSWRVVGITHAALKAFTEHDYKHKSKQGITRAHLHPRIKTAALLLRPDQPLSEAEFIETLLLHDVTVLCARGENRAAVPEYIAFTNDDATLFASKKVSWGHTKNEQTFLRNLHLSLSDVRQLVAQSEVAKDSPSQPAERKKGSSKVWNLGKKMIFNGVRVEGKAFQSVWAAFQALGMGENSGIPRGEHIRFRKDLKKKGVGGKLIYRNPLDGKSYEFTLLDALSR